MSISLIICSGNLSQSCDGVTWKHPGKRRRGKGSQTFERQQCTSILPTDKTELWIPKRIFDICIGAFCLHESGKSRTSWLSVKRELRIPVSRKV